MRRLLFVAIALAVTPAVLLAASATITYVGNLGPGAYTPGTTATLDLGTFYGTASGTSKVRELRGTGIGQPVPNGAFDGYTIGMNCTVAMTGSNDSLLVAVQAYCMGGWKSLWTFHPVPGDTTEPVVSAITSNLVSDTAEHAVLTDWGPIQAGDNNFPVACIDSVRALWYVSNDSGAQNEFFASNVKMFLW